jgi:hypothetical protein
MTIPLSAIDQRRKGVTGPPGDGPSCWKMTMHIPRVAILVVLLAGCADGLIEQQARDARFVGQPRGELVKSLGEPARIEVDGGTTRLIYEKRRRELVPDAPFCNGPGMWCGATGFPSPPPEILTCDTIFTVSGGIVRAYDLRGFCG